MTVKFVIEDGYGTGHKLKINGEGELTAAIHPHPPRDEKEDPLPFRQFFTDNGKSTGSEDMIVDGSSVAKRFYIEATQDYDIYIKTMSVRISDGSGALDLFGGLTALTNGVSFTWFTALEGEYVLHDGIKTNLEFVRLAPNTAGIGSGTTAFKADVSGSGDASYLPNIDLQAVFGTPWGLRLRKRSNDKISFIVNDALAGLSTFNIIGYGIRF